MREYVLHANEWLNVRGRGLIASILPDQIPEGVYHPSAFGGREVIIDGDRYKVLSVETFAVSWSRDYPYNKNFGLVVKKVDT